MLPARAHRSLRPCPDTTIAPCFRQPFSAPPTGAATALSLAPVPARSSRSGRERRERRVPLAVLADAQLPGALLPVRHELLGILARASAPHEVAHEAPPVVEEHRGQQDAATALNAITATPMIFHSLVPPEDGACPSEVL
ncbi:hypothetical protein A0H81_01572 [Grifola frondosa]|uniref:Uncharacterized protein n=1 Tax=Grifola frondosa TaxID=5627 RepID=A0A1C7MY23_GRIFR|nr:hypothetical protein A0H81_01572 [Grifola frondosa]